MEINNKVLYIGGGVLAVGAIGWFALSRPAARVEEVVQDSPKSVSGSPLPFYISGAGGGGYSSQHGQTGANLPLGGEVWSDKPIPLSENPDVKVAEINAGIAKAQIDAQKEVAIKYAPLVVPKNETKTRTASMTEIVNYLREKVSKPGGITQADIVETRDLAEQYGVSAKDLAVGMNVVTGTGKWSANEINRHISKVGLEKL